MPFSAVPVFPATLTPSILALVAAPLETLAIMACVIDSAVSGVDVVCRTLGSKPWRTGSRPPPKP